MTASAGWESWKLAHAYHRIGSGTTPTSGNADYYDNEIGTPWITTSELRETYIERTSNKVTPMALNDFTTLRTYAPNSVFMAMYGATIGRLGISTVPATCNQACCVFERSDKFDNRFLFYWLWHRRAELISVSVGGGQPNLSQQDLKSEKALCPPIDTQRRIASFLDEKTAQIDGLIARKQALLERLAEKRQAIITQAVTKGLNPAAPMKDSGIDWLGQIPAHWDVKRLKFVGDTILGLTYSPFDVVNEGEGKLVLRSSNVQNGKLAWGDNVFVQADVPDDLIVRTGDILICSRNGSRALIGKNAVITDEYAGETFGAFMTVYRTPMHRFIHLVLNSELFAYQSGRFMTSTINQLTIYAIKDFAVPIPPAGEQEEIADAVHIQLARLDRVADDVKTSMGKLTEYRSALITAAVTGQIEALR
ncbi:restriction endonuclease subunit S [Novosphingobium sp. Fuku2-ISO-50]|uniref:restriction endonuclease subunit S n=1 Tax=Novosphingobium sp. Fuku2-ISO-50 TaxID=1739114 RepID=UPI00076D2A23|nr:restriction endonuclease subunit S [Novosphingobium sp. Fuku2-ISO-50]KUR75022.1 hypothetical protein AQZ50_16500 [Novosphingobium sp. Fuku2-ISO-50]